MGFLGRIFRKRTRESSTTEVATSGVKGEKRSLERAKSNSRDALERLGSDRKRVANEAYQDLLQLRNIPLLLNGLKHYSPGVRKRCAKLLGELKEQSAMPLLIESLADEYPSVREESALALVSIGATEALASALKHSNPEVQEAANKAYLRLLERKEVPLLLNGLKNGSPAVRKRCAELLGELKEASAVPVLIESLGDAYLSVREEAALALAHIGATDAIDAISNALEAIPRAACSALCDLGAADVLSEALKHPNPKVRYAVLNHGERLPEPLRSRMGQIIVDHELFNDPDHKVSAEAIVLLVRLGYGECFGLLLDLLASPHDFVISGVNQALQLLVKQSQSLTDHDKTLATALVLLIERKVVDIDGLADPRIALVLPKFLDARTASRVRAKTTNTAIKSDVLGFWLSILRDYEIRGGLIGESVEQELARLLENFRNLDFRGPYSSEDFQKCLKKSLGDLERLKQEDVLKAEDEVMVEEVLGLFYDRDHRDHAAISEILALLTNRSDKRLVAPVLHSLRRDIPNVYDHYDTDVVSTLESTIILQYQRTLEALEDEGQLIAWLDPSVNDLVQIVILRVLGKIGTTKSLEPVLRVNKRYLGSFNYTIHLFALIALGEIAYRLRSDLDAGMLANVKSILEDATHDNWTERRDAAISALKKLV
jgi:hypothetical protein